MLLAAFLHNQCRNNGQPGEIAITVIDPRKEYWPSRGSNQMYSCLKIIYLRVTTSMGNKTSTVNQLKASCTVAPAKARRKSSLSAICPIDTIVLVTDVPMFAPITMGIASRTLKTEIREEK